MGSLVDEGRAAFDDHVIDRYPSFQMYDSWVTREFMIWDLMAQHSGMAPYAGDSAVSIGFTRQDFINDLYYARPAKDYAGAFLADAKARAEAGKFPAPGEARAGTGPDCLHRDLPQPVLRAASRRTCGTAASS